MSTVWRRVGLYLVSAAVLASCAAPPASPEGSSESILPSPSSLAGSGDDCEPVNLRSPAGERVDLTGTWRGQSAVHYVRQDGSCVWWLAYSNVSTVPSPSQRALVFRGDIAPDFTVTGEWMSLIRPSAITGRRHGPVTFEIEFESSGGSETITLRSTTTSEGQGGTGPYVGGATLTYEGPLPPVMEDF